MLLWLKQTCSIPGYAAQMAEDRKLFCNDNKSSHPVLSSKYGGDHVFVPFAMEDGGTLGAHALLALLKQLAEFAVSRGSFCSPDSRAPLAAPMQVSLWVQRWRHRLSTWLHAVTLSQQLLRMYHPDGRPFSAVLS